MPLLCNCKPCGPLAGLGSASLNHPFSLYSLLSAWWTSPQTPAVALLSPFWLATLPSVFSFPSMPVYTTNRQIISKYLSGVALGSEIHTGSCSVSPSKWASSSWVSLPTLPLHFYPLPSPSLSQVCLCLSVSGMPSSTLSFKGSFPPVYDSSQKLLLCRQLQHSLFVISNITLFSNCIAYISFPSL